ncbi:oocyte zinc finger protein XlCOF26 isoform X2 [Folsomia candida]|nr:oocyte zinc finger protein XlCOF26 isoform X2 [Folsomia candida]
MVTHDPDAKVKCEVCCKIFENRDTLSGHISRIHGNRKRPSCDTCHRVFSSLDSLRRHIAFIHNAMYRSRFGCSVPGCERKFMYKKDILKHRETDHAENPVRFPCTLCEKDFKTRHHLEAHIPTHTTEKPYNCAICGRSFAQKWTMKSHEMTHVEKSTRERLQCHGCPQTFLYKITLQRHIRRVHENQKNYPCAVCAKRFTSSYHLNRHVEAVHATNEDKIHSCDKCEHKSHSKANLAYHKLRHNAERHRCYFCPKKFLTFCQLVRHCRVHTLEK